MTEFNRNVWFRRGMKGPGWATAEYYGAKAGTTVNSLVAINNAIDDLAVAGGGTLYLGPSPYRVDGTVVMQPTVSLAGVPDATFLLSNSATLPLLKMSTGSSKKSFTEVSGIGFGAMVGNTGAAVRAVSANQRWLFKNCTWNSPDAGGSPLLNGRIFQLEFGASSSIYNFENCWIKGNADLDLLRNDQDGSQLNVRRSLLVWPGTLNNPFVNYSLGGGSVNDVEFDCTPHTTGSGGSCIGTVGSDPLIIDAVRAKATGGPTKVVLFAEAGTLVSAYNILNTGVNRYTINGALASGSFLDLIPHQSFQTSGNAFTIPNNIRALSARIVGSPGVAPVVTMPTGYFPGQELELLLTNNSGGNWSQVSFTTAYNAFTNTATNDGFTRTYRFKFMSMTGSTTYNWVCIGTFSSAFF